MATKPKPKVKPRIVPELAIARWIEGKPVTLKSLRGKIVLLHFWSATPYLEDSFSQLLDSYKGFKSRGVVLVSVLVPGYDETYLRKVLLQQKMDHSIGLAHVDQLRQTWVPYLKTASSWLFLIDRKGLATPLAPGDLDAEINKALARR